MFDVLLSRQRLAVSAAAWAQNPTDRSRICWRSATEISIGAREIDNLRMTDWLRVSTARRRVAAALMRAGTQHTRPNCCRTCSARPRFTGGVASLRPTNLLTAPAATSASARACGPIPGCRVRPKSPCLRGGREGLAELVRRASSGADLAAVWTNRARASACARGRPGRLLSSAHPPRCFEWGREAGKRPIFPDRARAVHLRQWRLAARVVSLLGNSAPPVRDVSLAAGLISSATANFCSAPPGRGVASRAPRPHLFSPGIVVPSGVAPVSRVHRGLPPPRSMALRRPRAETPAARAFRRFWTFRRGCRRALVRCCRRRPRRTAASSTARRRTSSGASSRARSRTCSCFDEGGRGGSETRSTPSPTGGRLGHSMPHRPRHQAFATRVGHKRKSCESPLADHLGAEPFVAGAAQVAAGGLRARVRSAQTCDGSPVRRVRSCHRTTFS